MITKTLSVFCDHAPAGLSGENCPHWIAEESTTAAARAVARSKGWTRVDSGLYRRGVRLKYDLSPECSREWEATRL